MMSLSSSFSQIYDKTNAWKTVSADSWSVIEHEDNAITKKLTITMPGRVIHSYGCDLVKGVKDSTDTRSNILKDLDCDGTAIAENDGKTEIVYAELKSTFNTEELRGALFQLIMSFAKTHGWFSLCQDYSIENTPICFVLACQTFKDKDQEAYAINLLKNTSIIGQNNFEKKILPRLLNNLGSGCEFKLSEFYSIGHYPFAQSIKDKKVRIYLALSDTYGNPECKITLH